MKPKLRYEIPLLVDLSAESALGATCSAMGINASNADCQTGSCPQASQCSAGNGAQACYPTGQLACDANSTCLGCCQSGSSFSGLGMGVCNCNVGGFAVWNCTYGNLATKYAACTTGGFAESCP